MITSPLSRRAVLTAAFLLLGLMRSGAGSPPHVPTLQPYRVTSPEGTYLLEVVPSTRNGAGPSLTTLTNRHTGAVAWKRKLPFTFWQACLNDDGFVGGFGYTTGPIGGSLVRTDTPGEFFIRILDPQGTILHNETTRRAAPVWYVPSPTAEALALDAAHNRMVVLMDNQTFRSYDLKRGFLLNAVTLSTEGLPMTDCSLETFHPVPRTSLLLLNLPHWSNKNDGTAVTGSVFALMNLDGKVVWAFNHEWTLPRDWEEFSGCKVLSLAGVGGNGPDPFAPDDVDPFGNDDPQEDANAPKPPPAQPFAEFILYLDGNDHGERVSFRLSNTDSDHKDNWKVAEVKREKWKLPEDNHVPRRIPRIVVRKLAEFRLPGRGPGAKPLSDLTDVALGPNEQIYAHERKTGIVHVFDRTGKLLHRCEPREDDPVERHGPSLTVTGKGEVFLKLQDTIFDRKGTYIGPNPNIGRRLHFSPQGVREEELLSLSRNDSGHEWHAQPTSDNILVTRILNGAELVRRDEFSSQAADLTHRPDGNWLESFQDVAFAPDGSFAIRDSSMADYPTYFSVPAGHRPAEAVSIYDPKGKPVRTINFTVARSFNRIAFDGKHLVATRTYHPLHHLVYVLTATGIPVGAFPLEKTVGADKPPLGPRPFLVNDGTEILLVDLPTATVYRYALPK